MAKAAQILEDIARDPRPVFAVAEDYEDGARVASHSHPVCQLLHAVAGVMLARIDDRLWTIPPGRALWIPAKVKHSFSMRGAVRVRALFVRPDNVADFKHDVVVLRVSSLAEQLIQRLVDTDENEAAAEIRRLIVPLLMAELRASPRATQGLRLPKDRAARSVAKLIAAHPEDRTEFPTLARRCGIGIKTLSRRFVAETGVTPDAWRRLARLSEAAARLQAGQSVSKVAFDLGYATVSGFCQAYRACYGETPGWVRGLVIGSGRTSDSL
jgi:AraC-like DNA-binding protein/quercetin dioxygenase-like cupin family protein